MSFRDPEYLKNWRVLFKKQIHISADMYTSLVRVKASQFHAKCYVEASKFILLVQLMTVCLNQQRIVFRYPRREFKLAVIYCFHWISSKLRVTAWWVWAICFAKTAKSICMSRILRPTHWESSSPSIRDMIGCCNIKSNPCTIDHTDTVKRSNRSSNYCIVVKMSQLKLQFQIEC